MSDVKPCDCVVCTNKRRGIPLKSETIPVPSVAPPNPRTTSRTVLSDISDLFQRVKVIDAQIEKNAADIRDLFERVQALEEARALTDSSEN